MDIREQCDRYAEIGAELIETEDVLQDIAMSNATIIYLASQHKKKGKGKIIYAECEKIPDKYKWAVPCDFTITVFEPNIEDFTEEQLRILLLHELMHIKIEQKEDGTELYGLNPHDVEEFREIIARYGVDWDRTEGKSEMDMLLKDIPAVEL